jgi:hypothetical protein
MSFVTVGTVEAILKGVNKILPYSTFFFRFFRGKNCYRRCPQTFTEWARVSLKSVVWELHFTYGLKWILSVIPTSSTLGGVLVRGLDIILLRICKFYENLCRQSRTFRMGVNGITRMRAPRNCVWTTLYSGSLREGRSRYGLAEPYEGNFIFFWPCIFV